jgi:hypothetical protein
MGTGTNPDYGNYYLEGRPGAFAVTLSYRGEGDAKDLLGVVILKRKTPTKLNGVWCQYSVDGSLRSGKTTWERP